MSSSFAPSTPQSPVRANGSSWTLGDPRMEGSGSDCKLVTFPGEGHFFFNWRVSPGNFYRCVGLLGDFLKQVGVLS